MTEFVFAVITVFALTILYFADAWVSWQFWQKMKRVHAARPQSVSELGKAQLRKFKAYTFGSGVTGLLWLLVGIDAMTPESVLLGFEARTLVRLAVVVSLGVIVSSKWVMKNEYDGVLTRGTVDTGHTDGKP